MSKFFQKTNLKAVETESEKLQSGDWIKFQGTKTVIVLPDKNGEWFKKYSTHYNIGDDGQSSAICLKSLGEEQCPICDLGKSFNGQDISPRKRWIMSCYDVKKKEVKVVGAGMMVAQSFIGFIQQVDGEIITDDGKAYTLDVSVKGTGKRTKYTTQINIKPIQLSQAEIKNILSNLYDFDEEIGRLIKSYDEVEKIVSLMVDGEVEEANEIAEAEVEEDEKKIIPKINKKIVEKNIESDVKKEKEDVSDLFSKDDDENKDKNEKLKKEKVFNKKVVKMSAGEIKKIREDEGYECFGTKEYDPKDEEYCGQCPYKEQCEVLSHKK